jgi:uncharacterized membrane protein YhiD involved in acid resistance
MSLHENSKDCAIGFDYDAVEGKPGAEPLVHSTGDLLEALRRNLRYIRSKDRARLTVDCLFLALGDEDAESETMTSIAEKHGLTKAAVSKRTKEIRAQLHLSINQNNKSADAVRQYQNNRSPIRLAGPS